MEKNNFFKNQGPFTLKKILDIGELQLTADYNLDIKISNIASLKNATASDISFFSNIKYVEDLKKTHAGFCIIENKFANILPKGAIGLLSKNPYLSYAKIANLFYPYEIIDTKSIASSAKISSNVQLPNICYIGENVVIEEGVVIGEGTKINHNSVILKNVIIGSNCSIGSSVTISHAIIGDNVIIHPGAKIGQDGFGFASGITGHFKIPQIGRVIIGNDVEIGSNSTIDRGAGSDTIIGDMTKIDNLVQIAHNVKIGKACFIVAQTGISGSTIIGDFVALGGQSGVSGHIKIGDFVNVAAQSGVISNIQSKSTIGGTPAVPIRDWHRQTIMLKKLINKK